MDDSVIARMKEVDAAVKKLDPAVRGEAFAMMREYILEGGPSGPDEADEDKETSGKAVTKVVAPADLNGFVDKFESETAAENVMALVAWLYGQYGIEPFSVEEVKDLADQAQVTISTRVDMTLKQKTANNKKAFRKAGQGRFRPTVDGEAFLKETFGVKRGNKKRPVAKT